MIYKASLGSTNAAGSCCGSGLLSQPSTVSPPAGRGPTARLQDGKMAGQTAESACFFSSSSSANESIDVASGPRPSFNQTTDTNWQHVSWFTVQTGSLDSENHSDFSQQGLYWKKRHIKDCFLQEFTEYKDVSFGTKRSIFAWSGFNVWSQWGNVHGFSLFWRGVNIEILSLFIGANKQLWVCYAAITGLWMKPLPGCLPILITSCINQLSHEPLLRMFFRKL